MAGMPVRGHPARRRTLVERLAASQSPGQRIGAACDYLRATLKAASPDVAEATAGAVVDILVSHADQIVDQITKSQSTGNVR